MTFEEERLQILQRVSAGELTPEEGSLRIAMLRVQARGPRADQAGRAAAGPGFDPLDGLDPLGDLDARDGYSGAGALGDRPALAEPMAHGRFAGHPFAGRHHGPVTGGVLLALALPFLLVAGLLGAFAFAAVAAMTALVVWIWNGAVAARWLGAAPIGFFPTCWWIAGFAAIWTFLRWRRRLRDALGR